METPALPSLSQIETAMNALRKDVLETPVLPWRTRRKEAVLDKDTEVWFKLELFQGGGSFKLRGALLNLRHLDQEALQRGITAVSAGNHAIACAMAASLGGSHVKVVMPKSANPGRVQTCRELGAEVVLVDNVNLAFEEVERIQAEEGRTFVHPFEGELTALGTATVGWEWAHQVEGLEAVVIPIGGGGLAAGMGSALKQLLPDLELYGVEPYGADSMYRSFQSGQPERIEAVRSIADSLGSPFALPYSFGLCQQTLQEIVRIEDSEMQAVMQLFYDDFKLVVEPAGAASLAAVLGPLRDRLRGKRVGCIVCGSNIDLQSFEQLLP